MHSVRWLSVAQASKVLGQLVSVVVLSRLLPGCLIADMVAVLGSMFFVVGDIDK